MYARTFDLYRGARMGRSGQVTKESDMLYWEKKFQEYNGSVKKCACGCGKEIPRKQYMSAENFKRYYTAKADSQKYINKHDKRPKNWALILTPREEHCILGTCLGDGLLRIPNPTSKNPHLCWSHSTAQLSWGRYKKDVLSRLLIHEYGAPNQGYTKGRTYIHTFRTRCLPALKPLYDKMYKNNKKQVTLSWLKNLKDESFAWWFCDDGSYDKKGKIIHLHTEGLTLEENILCKEFLSKVFGRVSLVTAKNNQNRIYTHIRFLRSSTDMFFDKILPFVPKDMYYKSPRHSEV